MFDLMKCYGVHLEKSGQVDIDALPLELRHVLHKYALAVKWKSK